MAAFVIASTAGRHFVFNPAGTALNRGDQMLGGGGVEAVVELHRTPDAEVTVAVEDGLHALPAIHLTGFLAVHSLCKGTGARSDVGLGVVMPVGAVAGTHEGYGQPYGI